MGARMLGHFCAEAERRLAYLVFIFERFSEFDETGSQGLRVRGGDCRTAFSGYGVVLSASVDVYQLDIVQFSIEEAAHLLNGVYPFLVDVIAAMAAKPAADSQFYPAPALLCGCGSVIEHGFSGDASGAAYEHLPFILGIEVDKGFAGKEAFLHLHCTVHSGFLGDGEDALKLSARSVAVQERKAGGNAYSVICTECGVLGYHPSVLDNIFYRIGKEVMLRVRTFLADHILMRLQNKRRHGFLSRSGLFGDAYVAYGIAPGFKLALCSPLKEEVRHRLLMSRFTRNRGDFLENVKDRI